MILPIVLSALAMVAGPPDTNPHKEQEKLVPAIAGHDRIVWNIRRLIDGAGRTARLYETGIGNR